MIELNQVVRAGAFVKPHGVSGEMALTVPPTLNWTDDLDCLVCSMDGILVPFWLESIRSKSSTTILVKFEGVDKVEDTARFMGVTAYIPRKYVVEDSEQELTWSSFIDWKIMDEQVGFLGTVCNVDDSTPNILFLVRNADRERIIPANEDWITNVDQNTCTITFNLPEGLVDL